MSALRLALAALSGSFRGSAFLPRPLIRSHNSTVPLLGFPASPRPASSPSPERLPPAFSRGPLPCRRRRTRLPVSLADAALALRVSLDGLAGPPSRMRCPRLPFSFAGAAATPSPPHPAHRERAPSPRSPDADQARRGPRGRRPSPPPLQPSSPTSQRGRPPGADPPSVVRAVVVPEARPPSVAPASPPPRVSAGTRKDQLAARELGIRAAAGSFNPVAPCFHPFCPSRSPGTRRN